MSTLELSSLYSSGDIILTNPIESSAIFLVVVVICASIEYLFTLAGDVGSKFFRVIFETISEEVLVVGVLSLLLTFGSSIITSLPSSWATMFQWTHICLLFMGITFVTLLILIIVAVFSSNTGWKTFESHRMSGSPEGLSNREQKYRLAYEKFQLALRAHNLSTSCGFAQYVLKAEKRNLVSLGNLSWKSWLALSTIVVLNALRTKIIPQQQSSTDPYDVLTEQNAMINVSTFIVLAGYGTLGLFFYIHFSLQHRFRQYLMLNTGQNKNQGEDGGANHHHHQAEDDNAQPMIHDKIDLDDPQSFLLWQNLNSTMSLIQACLMFLVWYSAVFFLNMVHTAFTFDTAVTMLMIIAAMIPLAVFVVLVPWTLTTVAMLSTLGTNLNQAWVKAILAESEAIAAGGGHKKKDSGAAAKATTSGGGADDHGAKGAGAEQSTVLRRNLRPVMLDDQSLQRLASSPGSGGGGGQHKLFVPSMGEEVL